MGTAGVAAIDISDPATPQLLSLIATPGSAQALAVEGSLLAVADWDGVRAYAVDDPAAPVLAGAETGVGDRVLAVGAGGGYLYAGEWRRLYAFSADITARGPEIRLEPDQRMNVGSLDPGLSTLVMMVLHNDGAECMEVTGVSAGAPLAVSEDTPFLLPPGGLEPIEMWITPTSTGPGEATVTIQTDDPDEPAADLLVQWNQPGAGVGDPAVDFALSDEDGTTWSLVGCAGSCVLLAYFATA